MASVASHVAWLGAWTLRFKRPCWRHAIRWQGLTEPLPEASKGSIQGLQGNGLYHKGGGGNFQKVQPSFHHP